MILFVTLADDVKVRCSTSAKHASEHTLGRFDVLRLRTMRSIPLELLSKGTSKKHMHVVEISWVNGGLVVSHI